MLMKYINSANNIKYYSSSINNVVCILSVLLFLLPLCAKGTEPLPGPAVLATKGEVWPKPWRQIKSKNYFVFNQDQFKFKIHNTGKSCDLLLNALDIYKQIIQKEYRGLIDDRLENNFSNHSESLGNLDSLTVFLTESCDDHEYPSLGASESYSLTITPKKKELKSSTIWGIMRGLETFSQLIYLDSTDDILLRMHATEIIDQPRYPHRGLLLDTARHWIPLKQIYKILDGLAYNKMNVFHWHITDDQSFPYVSENFPELSKKGAYTQRQIYKIEDIKQVIEYARLRGIRVIPEFDTPGHTRSWGLSHPELICKYRDMYGPMDPSKNTTYAFLKEIFTEIRQVFKDNYIHLGGDEVDYHCWIANPSIVKYMNGKGLYVTEDYINYYGQKVFNIVNNLNFSTIVWEEMFFDGVKLSNESIVQIWRDWSGQLWTTNINTVTASGKKAILSACWYLDVLSQTWKNFYECDPSEFGGTAEQAKLIVGGEACMWGENINESNVVPRIFPRASAVAEKLWSEYNSNHELSEQAQRLEEHSCRMNRRGVSAEPPNGPGYCE